MKLKIEARHLRMGDVLLPTNRKVTHPPYRTIHAPPHKRRLGLDGKQAEFNASTIVLIDRAVNKNNNE